MASYMVRIMIFLLCEQVLDAKHQFFCLEWFHQVSIDAGFQSANPVFFAYACRDHDDWYVVGVG